MLSYTYEEKKKQKKKIPKQCFLQSSKYEPIPFEVWLFLL